MNALRLAHVAALSALLTPVAAPSQAPPAVLERRGVATFTGAEARQRLDLYLPGATARDSAFAVVLFVHGGSLSGGARDEPRYAELCRAFAGAGIGCASVGYRLFPSVDWPAPATDVARAVRWVRDSIGEAGGDARRIFLLGHSSGCTLASLLGVDSTHLARARLAPRDLAGVIALGCRLNGGLDTAGVPRERVERYLATDEWARRFRGDLAAIDSFRPFRHVSPGMPPFLVLMGERERFRPPLLRDAVDFVSLALDCGADAEVRVVQGRGHEEMIAALADPRDEAFRLVAAWIRRVVAGGTPPARYDPPDLEACRRAGAGTPR